MRVKKDGIEFEIAEFAVNAALRNGYEIVKKAEVGEKPSEKKPKKK